MLIKESSDTENIHRKVTGIEIDVNALKKSSLKHKEHTKPSQNSKLEVKNCRECDETFVKNSDLEVHIIAEHGQEKAFKCDICDKLFVLGG